MQLTLEPRELRFAEPQRTAHGLLRRRELIEVTLTDDEGASGRGEAAPLESYDGVSTGEVMRALGAYRKVAAERTDRRRGTLIDRCRAVVDLPQALAAIDLAVWDLAGRRAGRPSPR